MLADHEVLHDRYGLKQLGLLERAGNTSGNDGVGRQAQQIDTAEGNRSPFRMIEAADAIEHGGLAGPVGPNETEDLAFIDIERDIVEGDDAPKTLGERLYLELHP